MLKTHENFVKKTIEKLSQDKRIVGILAGGSFITGEMDEFSDIDFVIAIEDEFYEEVQKERFEIIQTLGEVVAAFTGEHVGENRLIISLYKEEITLHVDFKFIKLSDTHFRVEDPVILWQKDKLIDEELKKSIAVYPVQDLQWYEDRFWVWVHYAALKIGRGELFETIEFISFLRQSVIGPLILMKMNKLPRGVRKIETDAPPYLEKLKKTIASYSKESCISSLRNIIELYIELREYFKTDGFLYKEKAEKLSLLYLKEIEEK